jgi:hypothetical protein
VPPARPHSADIGHECDKGGLLKISRAPVTDFRINWVWLPPWGPDKITENGREQLRALGFNV